eukprot:m.48972 g.48972  ORF g.48972 m.48972 type:complete len:436 (+) comp13336_c0_seq1:104-1411(+)
MRWARAVKPMLFIGIVAVVGYLLVAKHVAMTRVLAHPHHGFDSIHESTKPPTTATKSSIHTIFSVEQRDRFFQASISRDVQIAEGFDLNNIYSPYREFKIAALKARNQDYVKGLVNLAQNTIAQHHPSWTAKFSFGHMLLDPIVGQHHCLFFNVNASLAVAVEIQRRFEDVSIGVGVGSPTIFPIPLQASPLIVLLTVTKDKIPAAVKLASFMSSFASLHSVRLMVVLVTSSDNADKDASELKASLAVSKVPVEVTPIALPYNRARAIQHGMDTIRQRYDNPKVLSADVDLLFISDFLTRCQHYAQPNRIYFPVLFSMYRHAKELRLSDGNGQWRTYGYGMFCLHAVDFTRLGGMDTTIEGWGLEDLRFYQNALKDGATTVIRAADKSIIHQWHEKQCAKTLSASQLKSCLNSKMEFEGNKQQLAHQLLKLQEGV